MRQILHLFPNPKIARFFFLTLKEEWQGRPDVTIREREMRIEIGDKSLIAREAGNLEMFIRGRMFDQVTIHGNVGFNKEEMDWIRMSVLHSKSEEPMKFVNS